MNLLYHTTNERKFRKKEEFRISIRYERSLLSAFLTDDWEITLHFEKIKYQFNRNNDKADHMNNNINQTEYSFQSSHSQSSSISLIRATSRAICILHST